MEPVTAGKAGRRSERVLLRVPIQIVKKNESGEHVREKAYTVVINRHGARINTQLALRPGESITITNLRTEQSCPFRVVMRVEKPLGEGAEWGVECLEPERNFWGIQFPERRVGDPHQDLIHVVLECATCHSQEVAGLHSDQYRELISQSNLTRPCRQCKADTNWKIGFVDGEAEAWAPSAI